MQLTAVGEHLTMLHLAAQWETLCQQAAKRDLNYQELLLEALTLEWQGRRLKGIEARLAQARLPWRKTLEPFDFSFQPRLDRKLLRERAGLAFGERAENVLLLGPPGVGKTHWAVALGIKAIEAGHRVLFMTLDTVIGRLKRAYQENRLDRQLQPLTYPKVLSLDEIGYLPMTREQARLFFRLIVRRYEKASLILTSHKSFIDGGELLGDQMLATAILDRLLHHATPLNIKGESSRLKEKRKAGLVGQPAAPGGTPLKDEFVKYP